jgi:hypothetical protein
MVVSRHHCTSLASMGSEAIAEYESLVRDLTNAARVERSTLLEAEHGGTSYANAGSCVDHAHVHLLPEVGGWFDPDGLAPWLPRLASIRALEDLATTSSPYTFLRSGRSFRAYDATRSPSMLLRRLIAEEQGHNDWDWGLFPLLDRVQGSINYWTEPAQRRAAEASSLS